MSVPNIFAGSTPPGDVSSLDDNFAYLDLSRNNAVINGDFRINQRVYTSGAATAADVYMHDRWKAGVSGCTYTFTQLNSSTAITITAGSLIQVIEGVMVEGTSYTLSWEGTASARYAVNSNTPTGSYASSPITITGQTAGNNMSIEFNTGTLGKVMLNVGSNAMPFISRPYPIELNMCMRYFYALVIDTFGTVILGLGQATGAGSANISIPLPVPMRVAPSGIFVSSPGHFGCVVAGGGLSGAATSVTWNGARRHMVTLALSGMTGLAAGNATAMVSNTNAATLQFTGAEL